MKRSVIINSVLVFAFLCFVGFSFINDYNNGKEAGLAFLDVSIEMIKILPCAFILIGLFDVWVKKEVVMNHLGENCGIGGYLWVLLLAGVSVGGLYVAFPIAKMLNKKGASLKIIFTYLGFAGAFRIPMTIFEISFLGLPFTLIRLMITIPLFFLIGIVLGSILKKHNYNLKDYTND